MYPNYMNKPSFMTNTTGTTFGAATTSSFGQPAANTPMFSSMQPSNIFQAPSTSSFNAGPSSQTTFGSNLFGQQQQPSTSGLFGSSNTFGQNKATFGFGSTPSQTGLFGQQPQQQTGSSLFQSNTTNLFGSTNAFGSQAHTGTVIKFSPVTGTDTMQKNGVTQSISTKHHCITCMKEYENKSLEELRFEDYSCNRKGPQQQTGFSSAPFGANTGGTSSSLFGQTDNKQGFGQSTSFGQTSTFGQTTPGFGVTNPTNTPSLFGKPTFGAATTTTTFGFNAPPATSNPFSANQASKPFSQPSLFGVTTTQPQTGFGSSVFGQTNTQNTTSNLFQKPAQPTTGFNTGQTGFAFNQTTQASNLFNVSKPNTGFGIFGQTNTGTTGFGQTTQPTFGTNFGKLTTLQQPIQPAFGNTLGGGMQQPSLFTNTAAKPTNLFGNTNTGGSLFNNNVFQPTPTSFSLNMNQQQPAQFPPEPSDELKNISLIATDLFPDGPHVYGLEPILADSNNSTTNPQDIKAMLDFSKKREELLGIRSKIKVHLPKPKRGNSLTKEFFDTNQTLRNSPKCLVIRKFNDDSSTIYNKYTNELIEEAEQALKGRQEKMSDDSSYTPISSALTSPRSTADSVGSNLSLQESGSGLSLQESRSGLPLPESRSGLPLQESRSGLSLQESGSGSSLQESRSGLSLQESRSGLPLPESRSGLSLQESRSGISLQESRSGISLQESRSGLPLRESRSGIPLPEGRSGIPLPEGRSGLPLQESRSGLSLQRIPFRMQFDQASFSEGGSDDNRSVRSLNFRPLGAAAEFEVIQEAQPLHSTTEESLTETDSGLPPTVAPSSTSATTTVDENPAGVILTKPEYYMYPALKDLPQYMDDNGECVVQGLTIGRRGYGNVYFPDPIDIANMNFDEIVHFRHREIVIYPDDANKPPVGEGLNRRAQVTLEKIFPREKGSDNYVTDVDQIMQSNFVDNLMHVTQKHSCKFVDYRPKTGSWVFKVKHFSKYSFTDSDEEDCRIGAENKLKKQEVLKKLSELENLPKMGLGGVKPKEAMMMESELGHDRIIAENDSLCHLSPDHVILDSGSYLSEPLLDIWPDEEHFMITEDMYHTKSQLQTIKASLFDDIGKTESDKKGEEVYARTAEYPSEVLSAPKVFNIPDISLLAVCENVTETQRCYTDLGIFKNNTYKVGWGKGFRFFNFNKTVDVNLIFALNQYSLEVEDDDIYNLMMPKIIDMLKITLEQSEFTFDDSKIPTLRVKNDLSYLEKQTRLFNRHARVKGLIGKSMYLASVWNLCSALWGQGDNTAFGRRDRLSNWLKASTNQLSEDFFIREKPVMNETEAAQAIFNLLSFHKVEEACEFASKHKMRQLSTLISQLSANDRFKFWMRKSFETFTWKEKNVVLDDFKKVYLLLAGVAVDEPINICEKLDWMRAFGIHLWYGAPSSAPIHTAFNLYKKAFEEYGYAIKPIPHYSMSEMDATDYDLLYHILGVYCDCTYQLCRVLHPETHTDQLLDYRLSWFLLQLFLSLNVGLIRESEKDHLHTTFASQLENMGQWKWAIFALLYLEDNTVKKNLITRIMDRHLSIFSETREAEKELVNVFKIPPSWIHEVKATKAKSVGRYYHYFQHYLYLEDWHEVNNAFVTHILPELFVNGQYDDLKIYLRKTEPCAKVFHDWPANGGLFKDFLYLYDVLHGDEETAVKYMSGQLGHLFRRLKSFQIHNDQQRLCIAELSRQCALLLKLIEPNIDDQTFKSNFLNVLKLVVMPLDIKYLEFYGVMAKYLSNDDMSDVFQEWRGDVAAH